MLRRTSALCAALLLVAPACQSGASGAPAAALRVNADLLGDAGDLAFPGTAVGEAAPLTLELVNLGDGTLHLRDDPPVRVIHDDALAFSVTQPAVRALAPGASAVFVATFTPRATGHASATLVIASDAPDTPELTLTLAGEGLPGGAPSLAVELDGVAASDAFDFGLAVVGSETAAAVHLINDGAGTLTFGPASVAVTGPDADQFDVIGPDRLALGAGDTAAATLTYAPTRCGRFAATLSVTTNASPTPFRLALTGQAIVSPQRLDGATDTSLLDDPDLTTVASTDGTRLAVANPAAASFAGALSVFSFDGCDLAETARYTASDFGYGGALFATSAALSGDGDALLVTARDHATAWLIDLSTGADAAPVTLATADAGGGHGRAAALAADASAVVIGQPLAASGSGAHGAVFLWRRPDGGWVSAAEATVKLLPADLTTTTRLGQSVAASADATVVAAAGLVLRGDQTNAPAAFVWAAHDGTWGAERLPTNAHVRNPTATLVAISSAPADATVRVAVAADGATIAFAVTQAGGSVDLHIFAVTGAGWGVPTGPNGGYQETAYLRLAGGSGWRFTLAADGGFIVAGDAAGVREFDRPAGGWTGDVQATQSWDLAAYGDLALGRGGAFIATLTHDGALQILWR